MCLLIFASHMRNILLWFFLFFRISYLIKVEKQPLIRRLFILHPRNMVDKCGFKIMNEIKSFRKKNEKCQWNSAYVNPFVTSPGDLRDLWTPFRYEARRSPGPIA